MGSYYLREWSICRTIEEQQLIYQRGMHLEDSPTFSRSIILLSQQIDIYGIK